MLLGLIGSIAYSSHVIKNDIQAEKIDHKIKPTLEIKENKRQIRKNFNDICKRSGIDIDKKTGNPYDKSQCQKGIEYLQYRGYDPTAVDYFKELFMDKYINKQQGKRNKILIKHRQLLQKYNKSKRGKKLITYRRNIYINEKPDIRMEKIMKNNMWSTFVDNYTYIHGYGTAKYTEIWNLIIPENLFNGYDINDIYDEICYLNNIHNGSFRKR